jgi:hypothetical protein
MFALLDPDADSESGSTDPIESGSGSATLVLTHIGAPRLQPGFQRTSFFRAGGTHKLVTEWKIRTIEHPRRSKKDETATRMKS